MPKPGNGHTGYVQKVREHTQRYAQQLIEENEKLRMLIASLETSALSRGDSESRARAGEEMERSNSALRALIASLEAEKLRLQEQLLKARDELDRHRSEQIRLRERVAEIQEQGQRFASQYAEVEQQNSNLANLYVASYRLHGSVRRDEVLSVLQEIVANLIGCEEMVVYERTSAGGSFQPIAANGLDLARQQAARTGAGLIGQALESGEVLVLDPSAPRPADPAERDLSACIPLKLEGEVIGAIALHRLLPQKSGYEPLDLELFDLLATHAATALYCSRLHQQTQAH